MEDKTGNSLRILFIIIVLTFIFHSVPAQEKDKPRIRKFGYSINEPNRPPEKDTAAENNSDDEDVIKVKTTLVVCDVAVTDKQGRQIEGLKQSDFIITEDGQPQQIESFALGNSPNVPRSIVLIFDYSNILFVKESVNAAKTLVDQLNQNDRIAIVTQDIKLLQDFTRDKEALKKTLDSLVKKSKNVKAREWGAASFGSSDSVFFTHDKDAGDRKPYSALLATLNEMFNAEDQRPVIIFQTDGKELGYLKNSTLFDHSPFPTEIEKFSLKDVYRAVENSRTTVYPVTPGFRFIGFTPEEQLKQLRAYKRFHYLSLKPKPDIKKVEELINEMPDELIKADTRTFFELQTALEGLADISGGWMSFLEMPDQAPTTYSRILSDINQRYILGYYPANSDLDGQRRKIKVEVRDHPEYIILGRKSYIASSR